MGEATLCRSTVQRAGEVHQHVLPSFFNLEVTIMKLYNLLDIALPFGCLLLDNLLRCFS